jgi:23S rRNA A2030 N6-methylase RlmJ
MNSEQLEEIKRHFSVVSEALRSDIRRIAEGHTTLCYELEEPRGEIRAEFKEIQAIQHSHNLEINLSDLKNRINRLETSQA